MDQSIDYEQPHLFAQALTNIYAFNKGHPLDNEQLLKEYKLVVEYLGHVAAAIDLNDRFKDPSPDVLFMLIDDTLEQMMHTVTSCPYQTTAVFMGAALETLTE